MELTEKPTKKEQKVAMASYSTLVATLEELRSETPKIEIEETKQVIKVPLNALKLLAQILKAMGEGLPISVVPIATEMTTQAAAELIGCSRPHFVKILEEGKMPYTLVGKHRRVKFEDVTSFKKKMKSIQEKHIIDIMKTDEESGLYDS